MSSARWCPGAPGTGGIEAISEPHDSLQIEYVSPEDNAPNLASDEQFRRNSEWLSAHWSDLLPGVRGRFIAVAGEEPFVADSPEEAIALARAAHPDDEGILIQYVIPERGWRIYAYCG